MSLGTCKHGLDATGWSTFNLSTEISACCDARVSIHSDGTWYCKCCYGEVGFE